VWQCSIYHVSASTDGGETWQTTEVPGSNNCVVSSIGADTGWVFSATKLRATADGGATWEQITLPAGVWRVSALSLRTPDDGYLMTPEGVLFTTNDGGESWSSQKILGASDYGEMILLPSDLPSAAIRFLDADRGVVVISIAGGGESKVVALRTSDGGQTWEEEDVPAEVGIPYLSRDGEFLTVASWLSVGELTVLRYTGD
jgi:photosystem II stability/assembly factor-like uncharacterized protein